MRISSGDETISSVNTNRLRSLLAYLVLHARSPQSREYLAFLLWPDSEEAQARTNLRQLLHHLRKALPDGDRLIKTDAQTMYWEPDEGAEIDVSDFQSAIAAAGESASRADVSGEKSALERAAALYEGDLLPDLYDEWLQPLREQLKQQRLAALSRLAELLEQAADYPAAIQVAERLIAADSVRELSYRQLMRLHLLSADRAAAVRVYHQGLKVLRRELGISPAPETRALLDEAMSSREVTVRREAPRVQTAPVVPLIGRDREWANLQAGWTAVEKGQTLLALIRGEAGIGKSRLAEELFSFASNAGTAVRTRCYSAHGNLSYAPLSELLRSDPLRSGIDHLPIQQLTELARILPELLLEDRGVVAPQPLVESWQRQHFFGALMAAFRSARRPLLLSIDDLQWCDRETLEWLHLLMRGSEGGGLMLLGTARSEEVDRDHPLLDLVRAVSQTGQLLQVDLGPLASDATEALARKIAGSGLKEEYLAGVYAETRGNPLFIIESVRSGIEDPEGKPSTTSLVNAVITARLGRLTPAAYEVAGLAASVGRSFDFDLLLRAGDRDEDSLAAALDELWHRRIIVGLEAQNYDFSHDRLREVAYAELSPIRKRLLHRRLAKALETLNAGDTGKVAGQVADHYERAGLPREAIPYYSLAAQAAKQLYADAEAAVLLDRALRLCRELPADEDRDRLELELLAKLEAAQFSILGYAAAEVGDTNAAALRLAQKLGEQSHLLDALGGGWLFNIVRGRLEEAKQKSSQFLAITKEDHLWSPTGHFIHGVALFHLGDLRAAARHVEKAVAAHRADSDKLLPVFFSANVGMFTRSYLSHIRWLQGAADQAFPFSDESIARARESGHPFSLAIASTYAAMLQLLASNRDAAEIRATEAVDICRQYDFSYYRAFAAILLGAARAQRRPEMPVLEELRAGLDAFRATGSELRLPLFHAFVAEVELARGLASQGLESIAAGLDCERRTGETWCAALLRCIRGDLFKALGRHDEAQACYREALDVAIEQGAKPFELRALAASRPAGG